MKNLTWQNPEQLFVAQGLINKVKSKCCGIKDIFNKKSDNESAATVSLPVVEPSEAKEVVESVAPVKEEASRENKPLTVSYATGWPIDVIYGYLHKNYEDKGFADAMVKSDLAFRDLNMSLIRNKILMVFREINLNYDVMKQDLQVRIDNCNAAGLLTTVAEIEKTMSLINAHKEELSQLELDFRNNANEASIPLQSYDCGFLRGIATIAMSGAKGTPISHMQNVNNIVSKQAIA